MNADELELALSKVPLEQRAEAREFGRMPPEAQRIWLFGAVVSMRQEVDAMRRPLWKQALGPLTIAGAFLAGFVGPDVPKVGP